MNNNSLHLQFSGPFILCGTNGVSALDAEIASKAGLYLWTVRTHEGVLVEYVGETGVSFAERSRQHMVQCLGGYYRIWDASLLRQGKRELVWGGMWQKHRRNSMAEFISVYTDLAPKILDYLSVIDVFVAPLDSTQRIRRRIERALWDSLGDQPPPVSTFLQDSIRHNTRRKFEEEPVAVSISCAQAIEGLPSQLQA